MLTLPTEIIIKLTSYLPLTSIFSLLQINRHFYAVITQNEHAISLSLVRRDFPTLHPVRATAPKGLRLYKHLSNEGHIRNVTTPLLYERYTAKIPRRLSISSASSARRSSTSTPVPFTSLAAARENLLGGTRTTTTIPTPFMNQVLLLFDFIASFRFAGGLFSPAIDSNDIQKTILASYTAEQLADLDLIVSHVRRFLVAKLRGTNYTEAQMSYMIASGLDVVEKVLNASEENVTRVIQEAGIGRVEGWVRWPVTECLRERRAEAI